MEPKRTVKGLLIGGSGSASGLVKKWLGNEIPEELEGHPLFPGTINIVLEVGWRYTARASTAKSEPILKFRFFDGFNPSNLTQVKFFPWARFENMRF